MADLLPEDFSLAEQRGLRYPEVEGCEDSCHGSHTVGSRAVRSRAVVIAGCPVDLLRSTRGLRGVREQAKHQPFFTGPLPALVYHLLTRVDHFAQTLNLSNVNSLMTYETVCVTQVPSKSPCEAWSGSP